MVYYKWMMGVFIVETGKKEFWMGMVRSRWHLVKKSKAFGSKGNSENLKDSFEKWIISVAFESKG